MFDVCESSWVQTTDEGEPVGTVYWPVPIFTDNSEEFTISETHQPGDHFGVGVTSVVYRAVDEAGNEAVCSFDVTIIGKYFTCDKFNMNMKC